MTEPTRRNRVTRESFQSPPLRPESTDVNALPVIYGELNSSFRTSLVFQLTARGVCSEISNLCTAVLYCLVNGIGFRLYSDSWNVKGTGSGWNEYFEPFCPETRNPLFRRRNVLSRPTVSEKWRYRISKLAFPNTLHTSDLWSSFYNRQFFEREFVIPELGINGDIFHAKNVISRIVFRPSARVRRVVDERLSRLDASRYVAVHVRRGDKLATDWAKRCSVQDYVDKLRGIECDTSTVFVATDDYEVVREFRKLCKDRKIVSLCNPDRAGFCETTFNSKTPRQKEIEMLDFLVDLCALTKAGAFVADYQSNVGRFVALLRAGAGCHAVGRDWHPF